MREIGAFEAKNKFSALLMEVSRGAEITITHRGKPVARMVPVPVGDNRDAVTAAAARIRARARNQCGPFKWSEWKHFRDEGRR